MKPLEIYELDSWKPKENIIYVIGAFESFHLGHYQLLKKAVEIKKNEQIVLVYFKNETTMFKMKDGLFCDNDAKRYIFSTFNEIDKAIELDFSKISLLEGDVFIERLTNNKNNCSIICGKDFKFGKSAKWDTSKLKNNFKNMNVIDLDLLKYKDIKIGTKNLKELLNFGQIKFLNSLLTRDYLLTCKIKSNLELSINNDIVEIHSGIYAAALIVNKIKYYCVLHISLKNNFDFKLIDIKAFEIENVPAKLIIYSEIRLITNSQNDKLTNEDILEAKNFIINDNSI